jgi:hypothetical protein
VILHDLRDMREGLASRIRRWRTMAARATPGPMLVRGGLWATGILAMVLAYPGSLLLQRYGLVVGLLALLPALAPRSLLVTPVILVAAAGWVISTMAYGQPVTLWRLVLLAGSLYLVHNMAALAAQLPYDAIVTGEVLMRWFARAGLVLAGTLVLGVYLLVIGEILDGSAVLLATLVGFGIAIGVTFVLARQFRRQVQG